MISNGFDAVGVIDDDPILQPNEGRRRMPCFILCVDVIVVEKKKCEKAARTKVIREGRKGDK